VKAGYGKEYIFDTAAVKVDQVIGVNSESFKEGCG
jgi:hypothetical protein